MLVTEIVQQAYAAFGEGDMETLASMMSDSYVGKLPESLPNGGTFNGPNDYPKLSSKDSNTLVGLRNRTDSII